MKKKFILFVVVILSFCLSRPGYSQNNSIVFSSNRSGNYEIYTMQADGSNLKKITNSPGDDVQPVWTPDGKKILFSSNRYGDFDIYSMNEDGTSRQLLTTNFSDDKGPAISPSGNSIAFYTNRDGNWEIYIMNKDGSGKHNITNNNATQSYPFWSPDGRFILYNYYNYQAGDDNWDVYKMDADGSSPTALTSNQAADHLASWSPNGQSIVFWSKRDGQWNIYSMQSNGSNKKKISTTSPHADVMSQIAWSPDSRFLVFPRSHELYKMNTAWAGLSNLTQHSGTDTYPAWKSTSSSLSSLMPAILSAAAIPDYTSRPAAGVLNGQSTAQRAFISQRGYPDLFSLAFITEGIDRSGHVKPLVTPRRLESWAYNGNNFSSVFFDNGFFVKETTLGTRTTLQATRLKPTQFIQGMTEAQIISMMGRPSCIDTDRLGGKTYRHLRYNPTNNTPAATVTIENGFLLSVTAGYAIVDSSHSSANLCTAQ